MFEKGITNSEYDTEHNDNCKGGIARSSLKIGDIRKWVVLFIEKARKTWKKSDKNFKKGVLN